MDYIHTVVVGLLLFSQRSTYLKGFRVSLQNKPAIYRNTDYYIRFELALRRQNSFSRTVQDYFFRRQESSCCTKIIPRRTTLKKYATANNNTPYAALCYLPRASLCSQVILLAEEREREETRKSPPSASSPFPTMQQQKRNVIGEGTLFLRFSSMPLPPTGPPCSFYFPFLFSEKSGGNAFFLFFAKKVLNSV